MSTTDATHGERLTALVTGASSGIGRALALVFAANGFDVALTARREERLQEVAREIEARYAVRAQAFVQDLARPDGAASLMRALEERGVRVDALVNNAGLGVAGAYRATSWQQQRDFLQLMVTAPCELTHLCLPGMVQRRQGYLLNVASVAGLIMGSAGFTLYGPAKSFLVEFSRCLHLEQEGSGVHVTALCPGLTRSEFHDAMGVGERFSRLPAYLWQPADTVAQRGFEAVMRNQAVCVTGWVNQAYAFMGKYLPDSLLTRLIRPSYREYRD